MKIAITGGAGFIGTAVTEILLAQGHEVIHLDIAQSQKFPELTKIADITDLAATSEALRSIDVIYHMAAVHRDDVKPIEKYYDVNVGGAKNVIAAAKTNNIKTIINTSSVAVYGLDAGESDETQVPAPFNDYGRSKLEAEAIFNAWAAENPQNKLVNARLVATFGPGNRGNIYNLINQIARGRFLMVGSGKNKKSIAYIGNVAAFLVDCLKLGPGLHLYNYADKPDMDMNEFVGHARTALGLKGIGPKLPYIAGLTGGAVFDIAAKLTGKTFPISAIRVQKFCANTIVTSDKRLDTGFQSPFSLHYGLDTMIAAEFPAQARALSNKREKILYILAEMEDFWSSRLPLALAAQEKGCEVHIAAPGAEQDERLKNYNFRAHNISFSERGFSTAVLKSISEIRKIIRNVRPDIVHTITLKYSFLTGMATRGYNDARLVFTIAGLGYLFSLQGFKPKLMRFIMAPFIRIALRHPRALVTFQNSDDCEILVREGYVRPGTYSIIPGSGVDLNRFTPASIEPPQPPIVVMPTRLVRSKGILTFIKMANILKERGIDARFQIAGGITDHNPLAYSKEEIQKMVKGTNTEWLGKVSDMPALYKNATLVVYPSYYREGIPRVLLEAAASAKAIITTDHPGCREAVNNNENGILVPIKNAAAAADAVEALLKDPARRKSMEQRSRARAESEFDVRLIAKKTMDVYGF